MPGMVEQAARALQATWASPAPQARTARRVVSLVRMESMAAPGNRAARAAPEGTARLAAREGWG